MKNNTDQKVGVILMTYGSATTAGNVSTYLNHVYKGQAPLESITDFEERYTLVGGSPLIDITKQQAALLEQTLSNNGAYVVRVGMLHSDPFIEEAVKECRVAGAHKIIGIILSPQFSSYIMDGYKQALYNAADSSGYARENVIIADPWPDEEHFISLLATRVEHLLASLREQYSTYIPVIFTTHSLPQRVVENDPTYLQQLQLTTEATIEQIGIPELEWYYSYQSAGHTPEVWLKPDIVDVLAELRPRNLPAIVIAPIQFLADHLEILYDLDVAAKQQCEDFGLHYHRIQLPNTDPLFITCLAAIVNKTALKLT